MSKILEALALLFVLLTVFFVVLYICVGAKVFFSLTITFGTFAYHLCIRLMIGLVIHSVLKNYADYTRKWYQIKPWEKKLYKAIKVKKWKTRMPTYNTSFFDVTKHSWDEIAQASCQAEIVDETIIVFSFLPIILSIWVGDYLVFLLTSIAAALFDLLFVIMQRYNRPRILKMMKLEKVKSLVSPSFLLEKNKGHPCHNDSGCPFGCLSVISMRECDDRSYTVI